MKKIFKKPKRNKEDGVWLPGWNTGKPEAIKRKGNNHNIALGSLICYNKSRLNYEPR